MGRHLCQDIVRLHNLHQGGHHPPQLRVHVVREREVVEEAKASYMQLRVPDGRDQLQHLDGMFLGWREGFAFIW